MLLELKRTVILLPIILVIMGCLKEKNPTVADPFSALEKNRLSHFQLWASKAPTTYCFNIRCFAFAIGPVFDQTVKVVVSDDTVRTVKTVSDSAITYANWGPANITVDSLFQLISHSITMRYHSVQVSYNDSLGYPTMVAFDPNEQIADDEITYQMSHLRDTTYSSEIEEWNPDPPIFPGNP